MSYDYATERPKLFTEDGQVMLLKIRDNVRRLLNTAGAFQAGKAFADVSGDSWKMLACLDRLVELGELERVTPKGTVWGQYEVFVAKGGR